MLFLRMQKIVEVHTPQDNNHCVRVNVGHIINTPYKWSKINFRLSFEMQTIVIELKEK